MLGGAFDGSRTPRGRPRPPQLAPSVLTISPSHQPIAAPPPGAMEGCYLPSRVPTGDSRKGQASRGSCTRPRPFVRGHRGWG